MHIALGCCNRASLRCSQPGFSFTWRSAVGSAMVLRFLVAAWPLAAQATVAGRVTILERPGGKTTDLANAVVYLEPTVLGRGALAATPTQIVMQSRQFIPRVRVVTAGSSVEFPNQDPFRHNVFSNTGPTVFDLGLYGRGDSKGATLRKSGSFPIFCNIHARMSAFVLVVPTPFFTQANADGRFSMSGVPPGRYTFRIWHDRGGEHARPLDVPPNGVTELEASLDARGYRFVQHSNKFGQAYSPAGRDRY